ncbi:MAG TPA: hypothetical protein VK357_03180 [Rubrobacteraceae bacterium]|nr:hypothetical protein [Rubrobacteraceae bacterium]
MFHHRKGRLKPVQRYQLSRASTKEASNTVVAQNRFWALSTRIRTYRHAEGCSRASGGRLSTLEITGKAWWC